MPTKAVNVHQTLSLGFEGHLRKQRPLAVAGVLLGALVLAIADPDRYRDRKAILAGIILIVAGLSYLVYVHWRRINPRRSYVLSSAGLRTRNLDGKDILISWNEVQGVETTDITLPALFARLSVTFRDATVLLVSRELYDKRIAGGSIWTRGPFWSAYFIPVGDQVQIALLPEMLSISPEDLRTAVEQRWRAFSNHPNAKLPAVPHQFGRTAPWLSRWKPSRKAVISAMLAASLLALPVIYYWQYIALSQWFPHITPTGGAAYLRDLLEKKTVQARIGNGPIVELRSFDVAATGNILCHREITRDAAAASTLLPAYKAAAYCTAELKHRAGGHALAIMRLESQQFSWTDYNGKEQRYYAVVPVPLTPEEADRRLCQAGSCGASPRP